MENTSFIARSGFCAHCGSILPLLKPVGSLTCYTCKEIYPAEELGNTESYYVLHFNSASDDKDGAAKKTKTDEKAAAGPIIERKCPRCGNDEMSYATLQLRSADEGQTVFYTCTKCQFKETENS